MGRARKRADRIREEIDISAVLVDYGYPVHVGGGSEEQFPCDLHGDGLDNLPSARVYPDSNSWYCFACDRARDAIETVREKEGLDFWGAVKALEKRYNLPSMPWDDDDQAEWESKQKPSAVEAVAIALRPDKTYEDDRKRVETLLDNITADRDLDIRATFSLWEAYDKVCYFVRKDALPEDKGREAMEKIRIKALDKLRGEAS